LQVASGNDDRLEDPLDRVLCPSTGALEPGEADSFASMLEIDPDATGRKDRFHTIGPFHRYHPFQVPFLPAVEFQFGTIVEAIRIDMEERKRSPMQ